MGGKRRVPSSDDDFDIDQVDLDEKPTRSSARSVAIRFEGNYVTSGGRELRSRPSFPPPQSARLTRGKSNPNDLDLFSNDPLPPRRSSSSKSQHQNLSDDLGGYGEGHQPTGTVNPVDLAVNTTLNVVSPVEAQLPFNGQASDATARPDQPETNLDPDLAVKIVSGSEFSADALGSDDDAQHVTDTSFSEDNSNYDVTRPYKRKSQQKRKTNVIDDDDEYEFAQDEDLEDERSLRRPTRTKSGRSVAQRFNMIDDSDDSFDAKRRSSRANMARKKSAAGYRGAYIDADEEEESFDSEADYMSETTRERAKRQERRRHAEEAAALLVLKKQQDRDSRARRGTRNSAGDLLMLDADSRVVRAPAGRNGFLPDSPGDSALDDNKTYGFRRRNKQISYAIPTIEDIAADAARDSNDRRQRGRPQKIIRRPKVLPLNMSGRQLENLFAGRPVGGKNSSDDDFATPRKRGPMIGGAGGLFAGSAGAIDLSGTPSNMGKISGNLADIDPLLPQSNISFDSVGGMDEHIQKLKEMVSLPLLYPEVFQRFNITPPRGVLFHGPPGTGKTLLARALASSCSTEGQKISFFMRKGADCLSKWVGEAERQLRLLFEEAKQCQPSIIFFDEIDGLAPVRSSKQEQIHASIVSTLLALMDGMDGRGQVVVIGATNRPDAVDPALRRPGRFDREFYFPLPNRDARRKIIDIHTKGWQPGLSEDFKDELALLTKGYGGADMRALCTEAALYAVQRRYPQIYSSTDRLLIQPETIEVSPRDFMLSAKNLIPSTARSTAAIAASLPEHMSALLQPTLDQAKSILAKLIPDSKQMTALEDAQFVQSESSFQQEKLLQTFEASRIFRPRVLLCGETGMGQSILAAAVFHHLEGYHIQSFDISTLVGDSTRAAETAVGQLFTEARRHKPSIIFIPSLATWSEAVSDTVKATMKGLLESVDANEPILVLATVEGSLTDVPMDVRSWFGFVKSNRVLIEKPNLLLRRRFFADVIENVKRPPTEFFDAVPRKKRKLEQLPKAPPPAPRKATEKEIAQQSENDVRIREYFKFKSGPVIQELKKRFKRFCKPIGDDYVPPAQQAVDEVAPQPNGDHAEAQGQPLVNGDNEAVPADEPAQPAAPAPPKYVDVDLDIIHHDLYYDYYLTPDELLADIQHIVNNATLDQDPESHARAGQMLNYARIMIDQTFDQQFRVDCDRMAVRERERITAAKTKRKEAREAQAALAAVQVQAGDNVAPLDGSPTPADRNLKRPRSDEPSIAAESPIHKRLRADEEEDVDMTVAAVLPSSSLIPQTTLALSNGSAPNAIVNSQGGFSDHSGQTRQPAVPASASTSTPGARDRPIETEATAPAHVNGVAPMIVEQQATPVPSRSPTPEPEIIHPPFQIPQQALESLKYALELNTADCTIEQLDQLRAMCFEAIYRSRKEWNRSELVEELSQLVAEYLEECKEWQALVEG